MRSQLLSAGRSRGDSSKSRGLRPRIRSRPTSASSPASGARARARFATSPTGAVPEPYRSRVRDAFLWFGCARPSRRALASGGFPPSPVANQRRQQMSRRLPDTTSAKAEYRGFASAVRLTKQGSTAEGVWPQGYRDGRWQGCKALVRQPKRTIPNGPVGLVISRRLTMTVRPNQPRGGMK
jgi:hypothetical protein